MPESQGFRMRQGRVNNLFGFHSLSYMACNFTFFYGFTLVVLFFASYKRDGHFHKAAAHIYFKGNNTCPGGWSKPKKCAKFLFVDEQFAFSCCAIVLTIGRAIRGYICFFKPNLAILVKLCVASAKVNVP